MGKSIFITGTGTDVGKTALSLAVLLWARDRGLRASYYKPVQCGTFAFGYPPREGGDAEWICAMSGIETRTHVTYQLRMAASPHLAAEREGLRLDPARIRSEAASEASGCDVLVLEGSGGAAVPLDRTGISLAALAADMDMPCLIACAPGLGTLHHTLSTLAYLKACHAVAVGFAICHREADVPELCADNIATLASLTGLPCFGELPYAPGLASGEPVFAKAGADAADQESVRSWYAPLTLSLEAWWNPSNP
jgi:dethiobiotin synthetase